ncbi:hypothetical protein TYRP_022690, partial [Tyrophagus putrescentiae]
MKKHKSKTTIQSNAQAKGHYHSTAGPAEEVGKMRRIPRSQLNSLFRSFFSDPLPSNASLTGASVEVEVQMSRSYQIQSGSFYTLLEVG